MIRKIAPILTNILTNPAKSHRLSSRNIQAYFMKQFSFGAQIINITFELLVNSVLAHKKDLRFVMKFNSASKRKRNTYAFTMIFSASFLSRSMNQSIK